MCWAVRKTALLGANERLTVGRGVQSWGLEKELRVMGRSHGRGSHGKLVHLSGSVFIFSRRDKSTGYLLHALSSTYVSVGSQVVPDELDSGIHAVLCRQGHLELQTHDLDRNDTNLFNIITQCVEWGKFPRSVAWAEVCPVLCSVYSRHPLFYPVTWC